MGSRLVILDPELCMTTPEYHWLNTGVRAVDHCVEALCSLEATEMSDKKAEEGLRLLVPSLLKCKKDLDDTDARHKCQMGVAFGMDNVRAGIPMGGSHAIGHQLGPLGVPHGVTSCIMCPAVMVSVSHIHIWFTQYWYRLTMNLSRLRNTTLSMEVELRPLQRSKPKSDRSCGQSLK